MERFKYDRLHCNTIELCLSTIGIRPMYYVRRSAGMAWGQSDYAFSFNTTAFRRYAGRNLFGCSFVCDGPDKQLCSRFMPNRRAWLSKNERSGRKEKGEIVKWIATANVSECESDIRIVCTVLHTSFEKVS